MDIKDTKEIYDRMNKVWPDDNKWYTYLHKSIIDYIEKNFSKHLDNSSIYLNAGSGGSVYNIPGTCYHVDISDRLINYLPHAYICSVENLPFQDKYFDAIICVGSVINYCSALETISQFSRVIKSGGYLILEFERSQSAELWFTKDYGQNSTLQQYDYLDNIHTLWLYSEAYIKKILYEYNFKIIGKKRLHSLSAIINRLTGNENFSGKFAYGDILCRPVSYFTSHNIILLCKKN